MGDKDQSLPAVYSSSPLTWQTINYGNQWMIRQKAVHPSNVALKPALWVETSRVYTGQQHNRLCMACPQHLCIPIDVRSVCAALSPGLASAKPQRADQEGSEHPAKSRQAVAQQQPRGRRDSHSCRHRRFALWLVISVCILCSLICRRNSLVDGLSPGFKNRSESIKRDIQQFGLDMPGNGNAER